MRDYQVVVYGAYGYTGSLIVGRCKARKLRVLLSGRNADKLKRQSSTTGYDYEAAEVDDHTALCRLLEKAQLVIHCGGPFQYTAKQMVEACLETGTLYTDITGEYTVFERLATYDARAKERGITIMPGTGFDVVPSDCLAVHLKNRLPQATHLQLAFAMTKGGLSRGTSRTMVEGLGYGAMIRSDGKLVPIALGEKVMDVDFGPLKTRAMCIPWGDIVTAWRSTGIPNIEVFTGVPEKLIRAARLTRWVNWIFRKRWVKDLLLKTIDARPAGPDNEKLEKGRSYLWGSARDARGQSVEARLETISSYALTAETSSYIAAQLVSGDVRPGYFTPAEYFGETLVFKIEGTQWLSQ